MFGTLIGNYCHHIPCFSNLILGILFSKVDDLMHIITCYVDLSYFDLFHVFVCCHGRGFHTKGENSLMCST